MNSNNKPLVSVVMATYNGEIFIRQQMESVLAQSYPNIEIIVVDDCSTDDTVNIIRELQAKSPLIKLLVNETNLGYIKNFEKGCSTATGDYIALCDQDDYWKHDKIEKMQLHIGNYPIIFCDSELCNELLEPTGAKISDKVNCRDFNNCLEQAIFCRIYGHATLIKKDFLQKATPFLAIIPHDWWLCYAATLHGGIKYLPEVMVSYRQHSANIFGVAGSKRRRHNKINKTDKKQQELERTRTRIKTFYELCPARLENEKRVLKRLMESYSDFSFLNNLRRMAIFFSYRKLLLASKKRSLVRQYLFCLKMFVRIA